MDANEIISSKKKIYKNGAFDSNEYITIENIITIVNGFLCLKLDIH